jgi:2-methylcitrate dehydratase PrpD
VGQPLQYYVNMPEDEAKKLRTAEKIERQLDEALKNTFPASDPVAIVTSQYEEDQEEEPAAPPPAGGAGEQPAKATPFAGGNKTDVR